MCSIVQLSWLPRKNAVGKALFALVMPEEARCLERLRSESLWVARTLVLLACRCYREREGRLPSSLDDLIPRYLKEVPLDPYDGCPLRYSAERGIIWSAGKDLKDGGGSPQVEEDSMKFDPDEPTFSIDFRTGGARS